MNPSIIIKISNSKFSIYDEVEINGPLWISNIELQEILKNALNHISLYGMPPRSRSKFVKEKICIALGYPIPKTFIKTRPRFLGQNFDVYVQKSNNLQIWNEEISDERRYVLIKVTEDKISNVRVINGRELQDLGTTGTLTIKHQATFKPLAKKAMCLSSDSESIKNLLSNSPDCTLCSPSSPPTLQSLYSIETIFDLLSPLVGSEINSVGFDQDRNRGTEIHKLSCQRLGYSNYSDNGQFPDILNQLLEIKLQTSPTIDIGKELPSSNEFCREIRIEKISVRNSDIRYAIFGGQNNGSKTIITELYVVNGANFYNYFPAFKGKIINKKIQIPLPNRYFS